MLETKKVELQSEIFGRVLLLQILQMKWEILVKGPFVQSMATNCYVSAKKTLLMFLTEGNTFDKTPLLLVKKCQ